MKHCYLCGKLTKSHKIGNIIVCHTCYENMDPDQSFEIFMRNKKINQKLFGDGIQLLAGVMNEVQRSHKHR